MKRLDIKNRFPMSFCNVKMHRVDEQTAVEKRYKYPFTKEENEKILPEYLRDGL